MTLTIFFIALTIILDFHLMFKYLCWSPKLLLLQLQFFEGNLFIARLWSQSLKSHPACSRYSDIVKGWTQEQMWEHFVQSDDYLNMGLWVAKKE